MQQEVNSLIDYNTGYGKSNLTQMYDIDTALSSQLVPVRSDLHLLLKHFQNQQLRYENHISSSEEVRKLFSNSLTFVIFGCVVEDWAVSSNAENC